MTMHDVHDHRQPHSMGIVDETLQLVGRAEARDEGAKTAHMIPE